jgi:hypothetical protein
MLTAQAAARTSGTVHAGFEDGLGRRFSPATRNNEPPLEILCFRHEITDVPAFDFALRERVSRLSDLQHPYFARIRKVDRLNDERGTVALMSDGAPGFRLIHVLTRVERGDLTLELNASLYLVRQLTSAIAVLHKHARVAHGAIATERLFVTPRGRLFVVEYVLGAALEQLKYSRERYWKELRVALPMEAGLPRFDERADLTQIGVVALSLILGRPLRDAEYPGQIEDLVKSASAHAADGSAEPLPSSLSDWLRRTIQVDARNSFRSVVEAQDALDRVLSESGTYSADAPALDAFLKRYEDPAAAPVERTGPVEPERTVESRPVETSSAGHFESDGAHAGYDAADAADDEEVEERHMMPSAGGVSQAARTKWIAAGVVLLLATAGGAYAARQRFLPATPVVATGMMTVNTDPPGAAVLVDGVARGLTPVNLSLSAGAHTLVVQANGESRTVPITIAAGAQISQYLELPKIAATATGQLQVRTEPAGARIIVDGTPMGKTPLTVTDLAPGEHTVTLESDMGSVTQKVMIEAGTPASLVVPLGPPSGAALSGWLSVTAPVVVELYERGQLLGTSGIDRIMLASGRHEIEVVSEPLGFRETRTVQVAPGKVSPISVTLPKGTVSLNAVPWASVSIDGENIGDTPIGNLPLTIGPHEVVFHNTELGEQRRIIMVTLRSPVRLSVDLTKK